MIDHDTLAKALSTTLDHTSLDALGHKYEGKVRDNYTTSDGRRFIVVPFMGNTIVAWTPGSKQLTPLATTKGGLDGVELLGGGRVLFTSWADSSLDVLDNGTVTQVSAGLPSPADIGLDAKRGRVAIPLLMEDRVEFRQLPAEKGAGAS